MTEHKVGGRDTFVQHDLFVEPGEKKASGPNYHPSNKWQNCLNCKTLKYINVCTDVYVNMP